MHSMKNLLKKTEGAKLNKRNFVILCCNSRERNKERKKEKKTKKNKAKQQPKKQPPICFMTGL